MGKHNRQRRAAKKRQQRRRAPGQARRSTQNRSGQTSSGRQAGQARAQQGQEPPSAESVVLAAAWSWKHDPPVHAELLDRLDALADQGQPVLATAQRVMRDELPAVWDRGWTPVDVVHVVARQLSAAHAAVAVGVIVADARERIRAGQTVHARWQAQIDGLTAHVGADGSGRAGAPIHVAVLLLALLMRLPTVPSTVPAPGSPESALTGTEGLDQRMLARVRALLAKAESTEFEEEAEALTAKAQELITRHAIAEALLHTPDDVGEPSVRRIHLDDPYVDAKAQLLTHIADANSCSAVFDAVCGWTTVLGFDRDLDAVELLGASLLAQATSAMARHGSRRDAFGRSTTRSFRRSFLFGFALRIGERLRDTRDNEVADATAAERGRLLPVLSARRERVEAAFQAAFPNVERRTGSISNATGWYAGQAAADAANLDMSTGRLGIS
jgi:hypothetical protein